MLLPATAVIIAAGDGGRINKIINYPKILIEVDGKSLLEHHLHGLSMGGVKKFILVVGYKIDEIKNYINLKKLNENFDISYVENKYYQERENGFSVYCGLKKVNDESCFVVMGDHIFDYGFLKGLDIHLSPKEPIIDFVDKEMKHMKNEWCTKVEEIDGYVTKSSKKLRSFNSLDIGLFIVNTKIVLEQLTNLLKEGKDEWNDVVGYNIRNNRVIAKEISKYFWHGVNTPDQYKDIISKSKIYLDENEK